MRLTVILLTLLIGNMLNAAELAGRVSNVPNGNRIILITEHQGRHSVRLQGIRLRQDHPGLSRAARQRLNGLIGGRFVRVSSSGVRHTGELSGFIDWGGQEVNLILVADGLALPVPEELDESRRALYQRRQAEAQQRRPGIRLEAERPRKPRPPSLLPQ